MSTTWTRSNRDAAPTVTPGPDGHRSGRGRALLTVFALTATAASVFGLVIGGSGYQPSAAGLPDPGPVIGWALPVVQNGAVLASILTAGWLLAAAFLDPQGRDRSVSRTGRVDLIRAAVAAACWCVLALVSAAVTLANALGLPVSQALAPSSIGTYAWDVPSVRNQLIAALLAAIVAVGCVLTSRVTASAAWLALALIAIAVPALAGHAAGLGDHTLAMVNGVAHGVAAALWVGGLVALAVHAIRRDTGLRAAATRFSPIAAACVVVLALSGLGNAYARLARPGDLLTSGYGVLVLAKTALLAVLIVLGYRMRRRILPALDGPRGRSAFARFAGIELLVMALAVGLGVALSLTAPTRVDLPLPSAGEELLGFRYPPAPSWSNALLNFRVDAFFLVVCVLLAGFYLAAVVRLRRRGDSWSWGRTASWLAGVLTLFWATNSWVGVYAQLSVGVHMVAHMTMTMMAPLLLVMGAPITLALRALKTSRTGGMGPRELLLAAIHSPAARVIANPLYVLVIYIAGIYGLYFTELFGGLMGSPLGHLVMEVHFLLGGFLLYWVVLGIDPQPRRIPYWMRMVLMMAAPLFHSFFAIALMMSTRPIGASWYGRVQPPWMTDPLRDTLLGGQVAWGVGEIPTAIVLVSLAVQWARSDEREAKRRDRQVDRDGDVELDAYNERLAALAARDARYEHRQGTS